MNGKAFAVTAALLAASIALQAAGAAEKANVVLITADTLRADHLHCYGYFRSTSPTIDALAAESLLFERVVVPIATTLPSHVSLLTSTMPLRHGVLWNRPFKSPGSPASLRLAAELFAEAGYTTAAFTSAAPTSAATGIDAGFQTFDGIAPSQGRSERRAEETVGRALEWLDGVQTPFFVWIHLFDPHHPYEPPPPFDRAFVDEPALFHFLDERAFPRRRYKRAASSANGYDGEILYMDGEIRRFLDRLRDRGLYDDSLVVFAADHGEGLLQHDFEGHGIVWNEQLRVPLLIKPPKRAEVRPGRNAALASLVDVLPTMVDVASLPIDERSFEGVNLVDGSRSSALSQQQWTPDTTWNQRLFTLTTERWKYFHYADGSKPDRLYDLVADPHETRDVVSEHGDAAAGFRRQIAGMLEGDEKAAFVAGELPDAVREQLRQLGYVD
jgi:arylsulfatase A-like enzyme